MIRRARLSFKPNVKPSARRDGVSASQPEEPVQPGDITATAGLEENDNFIGGGSTPGVVEPQRDVHICEKAAATSNENEPSKPAAAPLQRRKRISTLPNLAKPRVSSSAPVTPAQKPQQVESLPTLPVSIVPCKDEVSPPEKAKIPTSPKSQGSNSVSQVQHLTLPEKRTPIPQVPQFSPCKKASLKQPEMTPVKSVDFVQKEEFIPLKERPSHKSSTNECKITPKKLVASGNLEKERLRRAQKLRDLLKDELRKERKEWKAKHPVVTNVGELERSKLLMRDFIYFIPENNPMTSTFAETKSSEKSPSESQLSGTPVKNINNDEDDDLDEEEDEEKLLAPRVKVAEDGSIILDEESLTVEVSRSKAPIVEGNDPIFERGSTTTYSSFRKSTYSKPWSAGETDLFFLAISMVGTDFSMISQLFPHRERIEIKNKFKREERANSWRIDKAFRERTSFNLEFFSQRLERALEAAKKRRTAPRVRQPREKKATKLRKKQGKAAEEQVLSDGEMAILSDDDEADVRTEEKENEGSVSVKEGLLPSDNVPGKKRRNRKKKNDIKEPEDETCGSLPEDTNALPKKPTKSRDPDQVKDSELAVNDENLEDVQAAPDTLREKKKKKSGKKKSADKEAETQNTADSDVIHVPSSRRDGVDDKSAISDNQDNVHSVICSEDGEPSFTQSEDRTCAEESSLILFTEESECFSEPDDLSSLQESLNVIPQSQTLADQTGTFDGVPIDNSQEDSVFETSHNLTSDTPNEVLLEEDMAVDSHTETQVKGSAESQKDPLFRPATLMRSRFQRARPNVPVRTLAKQERVVVPEKDEITEDRNKLDSEELEFSITETPRKNDIPYPVQKNSSLESSELQPRDSDVVPPEFAAANEDISKEKLQPVRGRLVRPKPNLKKAPLKDKPSAPELSCPPESHSQDSRETSMAPCSVAPTHSCISVNKEEALLNEKTESSTSFQKQYTKSTVNPTPVQMHVQSPNASTVRTSKIEKCEEVKGSEKCGRVTAEDATGDVHSRLAFGNHEEQGNTTHAIIEDSYIPIKKDLSAPCISVQEVIPESDPFAYSVSETKAESKMSPAKLDCGQQQKPKPNLLKSRNRKGKSEMEGEQKADVISENNGKDLEDKLDDLSDFGKSTDFIQDVPTSDESCRHQNLMKAPDLDTVLPSDPKLELGVDLSEEVQKPAKPAVPTRGRLQRPKPNLGRALPKRSFLSSSDDSRNESGVEACGKSPESNQEAPSLSQFEVEKTPVLPEAATEDLSLTEEGTQSCVLLLETIGLPGVDQVQSEESPSVSIDDSLHEVIKKELSGFADEKSAAPTKPALTLNRLRRPKPNLSSSVTCPIVSAPQMCDGKEGKSIEDVNSSMENLSQHTAGKNLELVITDTDDAASPDEITHSYILPLETIVVPGVDQVDSEEPVSLVDNSSHVTIKNDLSVPESERLVEPSPTTTRSKLQRPKLNLGRSITQAVVSTPQSCDLPQNRKTTQNSTDASSTEKNDISLNKQDVDLSHESCAAEGHNTELGREEKQDCSGEPTVQLQESSCTGEQVEGPSVKPLRNRLQKPKPNLGRASVRKESKAFASEHEEVKFHSSSKILEHLESKESPDLALKHAAGGESAHTTINPAQLKRGRLIRPVPSLRKPSNKRQSALQSKPVDEEEAFPTDKDLEASSRKRKASECFTEVSPKRSCPELSQSSSDFALDQAPSTSAFNDGRQSNDLLEHSRFGQHLKRPVSATKPILTKQSENVSERSEKTTSRSGKSVKSKVAKPPSSKRKGKTTLVKIRAMNQDEDDDSELEFEDEDYDITPDKLNEAPVFVPFSLRSPKPVAAEIEETVEEFEIPVEDLGIPISTAQRLRSPLLTLQEVPHNVPVSQADSDNKGHCDGSTEAAMTLISMGNSVFQSKLGEPPYSDQCTENQLYLNTDCKLEDSSMAVQLVCAAENDPSLNGSLLKISHGALGLQVGNEALSMSTDEQNNDLVTSDLHTSEQSSHLVNVNVTLPLKQMNYPSIKEDAQQQACSMSGRLLEDGGSREETTFILTLVEIPISEGYSYSCDENSVDVLPAPVLISSGSSHVLPSDQSTGTLALSEPSSPEFFPSGQLEAKLMLSPPSKKRSSSISSEEEEPQANTKALLCISPEQAEDHRSNTAAFEENEKGSSMPPELKTQETKESHQSYVDIASSSKREEMIPEHTACSSRFSTVALIEKSPTTSYDSPSKPLSSSSRTQKQRPGKKPLGFLSLVCKEKQSKKTKLASRKISSQPKCKKAKVQEPEEQNPASTHEDAPSSEVPSHSPSTPTNTEIIPSSSQVSEDLDTINDSGNLDTVTQESPKSQDLATEEEASTVSEYFFSDIFMEVDE